MCINSKTYAIRVFNDGFIVGEKSSIAGIYAHHDGVVKSCRGAISKFSSKSARRLREFLLRYIVPNEGFKRVAITYTLPISVTPECWYSIIKRWRQNLIREKLACVWRIELQRRGVPHLHCVGYAATIDQIGGYWSSWYKACDSVVEPSGLPLCCHDGFLVYGAVFAWITGSRWYAYLAAHTAKRKNDQLGWRGRQWGVVNRDLFRSATSDNFEMSDWVATRVARCIRRRYHYKAFQKDIFGTRVFFGLQNMANLVKYFQECENEQMPF